jgi:hypothetical protein
VTADALLRSVIILSRSTINLVCYLYSSFFFFSTRILIIGNSGIEREFSPLNSITLWIYRSLDGGLDGLELVVCFIHNNINIGYVADVRFLCVLQSRSNLFCVHVNRIESLQGLSHHNVRPKVRRDCSRGQTFLYLFILLLVYDVHLGIHPSETWRILPF